MHDTAVQTPVSEPADICRIAPDRRRYKRVPLAISGRFMTSNKDEFACKLVDISVGGAAISTAVSVEIGEQIIAYFDHLGGLEGQVIRPTDDGFAIQFNATLRKRQRLADQLSDFLNQDIVDLASLRRLGHNRIKLSKQKLAVKFSDGKQENCEALDVSISGAPIESQARPPIGSHITVGKLRAEVMRHHEQGFGVAFTDIQKIEAIRKNSG